MMTADQLKHLRDALHPVHESSYVPPREERVTVDRRDLRAMLDAYDKGAAYAKLFGIEVPR